ncbi:MAG: hypothetical protein K8R21_05095 [Leptospira sp.]|nr:hypothetical protein [Leptospira sp.]
MQKIKKSRKGSVRKSSPKIIPEKSFYNYYNSPEELLRYLSGRFSGKGIFVRSIDVLKPEKTTHSLLFIESLNNNLYFRLRAGNFIFSAVLNPTSFTESKIANDLAELFDPATQISYSVQAMTSEKVHFQITDSSSPVFSKILFSGFLQKESYAVFFLKKMFYS